MKSWTTRLIATDILDPTTGEPLYVDAKIRPKWYWLLKRIWLFISIVWRKWETARIGWLTAWEVSRVAEGLSERR